LGFSVVLATNTFYTILGFTGIVEVPKDIDAGERPIGQEFLLFKVNISNAGNNTWVTLAWKNYTGPLTNTTFRIKNSEGEVIYKKWLPDEVINMTGISSDIFGVYANGNTAGVLRTYPEIRCNYCSIIHKNFNYTEGE